MNNKDLETVLSALHTFVLGSRPAYKDYLGEETIEIPGVVVCEGELTGGEYYLNTVNPRKFAEGETYLVTVNGETVECKVQYFLECSCLCNVDTETLEGTDDVWIVADVDGKYSSIALGAYCGQTISVSTMPTRETRKHYDVRKLPEECVPESVIEGIESAKKAANDAKDHAVYAWNYAIDAQGYAYIAQTAADEAQKTADAANEMATEAYRGYRDADWLGDREIGESDYIMPLQTFDFGDREAVSGGYRYPIKANREIVPGDTAEWWMDKRYFDVTAHTEKIQLTDDADVLETAAAFCINTKMDEISGRKYITTKYYYTPYANDSANWPMSLKCRGETSVRRKLPLTLSPYSAGGGIDIDENGVISAENESAIVYVNITQSEGSYSADKTFATITELYSTGNNVRAVYDDGTTKWLYDLVALTDQVISFQRSYGASFDRLIIRPDDSITSDARGLVTASTQVNGHRLSENITLTAEDVGATAAVLTSPNGTKYTITVDDEGVLHAAKVEEATE